MKIAMAYKARVPLSQKSLIDQTQIVLATIAKCGTEERQAEILKLVNQFAESDKLTN